ncbi:MAG: lamin tail domain-containing protein [Verrucomicrobiota bacterium]
MKSRLISAFGISCVLSLCCASAATVLDPTGSIYTGVAANSEFSSQYAAINLFSHNVTGLAVGSQVEGGPGVDWAMVGTGPGYVRFQVDQAYLIGSVFYAQRIGAGASADKIDKISLWASSTGPFAAGDPGTLPLTVVTVTNKTSGIWCEYPLPSQVTGRYFLIKVEQTSGGGGNIGGNEFRLGLSPQDVTPPGVVTLIPDSGSTVRSLVQVEVTFSEPVGGVDASDLLVNGQPCTGLTVVSASQYVFGFPQPANGSVQFAWSGGSGIHDLSSNSNAFGGGSWSCTLDPNAPLADVYISEFMASNGGGQSNSLHDELGNSPDWIELYNASSTSVDLTGWFLTDDVQKPTKWKFPATVLGGRSYLVVFASGRNTVAAGWLHTNFKLGAGGSYLGLFNPSTNVISEFSPAYPAQATDVSYGRDSLDRNAVGYFYTATPGAANAAEGTGFGGPVGFSRVGGTFVDAFNLSLSTTDTNCDIRYVVVANNVPSGSTAVTNIPTASSPLYTGPITVSQTAEVRARAFPRNNRLPGPPRTESYIQLSAAAAGYTSDLPVILIHNLNGGGIPYTTDQSSIVMVFEPVGGVTSLTNPPTLTARAGINIRGRGTAGFPKSSLAVEVWDEYNQDRKVEFCGMPEESDWVLYAPNSHDVPLMHNALMHRLARDMGRYSSRTRFAEVFLNTGGGSISFYPPAGGNYNGIYVIEEKVKRGKDRVDVESLDASMTSLPDITGGYMFKFDSADADERTFLAGGISPGPDGGATEIYVYPKGPEMVSATRTVQNAYLLNYINAFYTALNSASWTNPATGYAQYFDIDAGIDHHMLNVLACNVDALRLSGYVSKPRNGKITMGPLWDLDITQGASKSGDTRPFDARSWRGIDYDFSTHFFGWSQYYNNAWYGRMFTDPDFWQRYIDRYQELRSGVWSTNHLFGLVDELAGQVRNAQPRESVRWLGSGSSDTSPRTGLVTSYDYAYDFGSTGSYQGEIDFLKHWLGDRLNFMDTNFLARPGISLQDGPITNGTLLTLTPPSEPGSVVYFTLDGTDPRSAGGGISPGASLYSGPVMLTNTVRVMARAWNPNHHNLTGANNPPISSSWSGVSSATGVLGGSPLIVTEIMYHPGAAPAGNTNDADNFEFIELRNAGAQPVNLIGCRFTNGISFTFTATNPVTSLNPGGYVVLVRNRAAFITRYPGVSNIGGEYAGTLDNGGEHLWMEGALREPILDFTYQDGWYGATDGSSFSLVARNESSASQDWSNPASWRASTASGGSPGLSDPVPASIPGILVNEVLSHTDPPQSDSIELFNPTSTPANIGGWFLTDNHDKPFKYVIPANTMIPAGGFLVFNESQFNTGSNAFALSSLGEEVYLYSGDGTNLTGYRHGFQFGAQLNGVTFGRHLASTGEERFVAQTRPTLGALNAGPKVGPVVITEIMYHPLPYGINNNTFDEFIEIRNVTTTATPLFDTAYPTNSWRISGGINFQFPTNVTLAPLAHALIVAFNPDEDPVRLNWFMSLYNFPSGTPIFGPFSGNLDNAGDTVSLYRPDHPELPPASDAGFVPSVLVDEIRYVPVAPWPSAAAGTGLSLQRISALSFGDDPANWQAALPTAGSLNAGGATVDTDHDGLPDEWEWAHGLDPLDGSGVNGPQGDPDGDGLNNLQEYIAGTNPMDAQSRLQIDSITPGAQVAIIFQAASNHTYTVQYCPDLGSGIWQKLQDAAAGAVSGVVTVYDTSPSSPRYYRLVTPAQP